MIETSLTLSALNVILLFFIFIIINVLHVYLTSTWKSQLIFVILATIIVLFVIVIMIVFSATLLDKNTS